MLLPAGLAPPGRVDRDRVIGVMRQAAAGVALEDVGGTDLVVLESDEEGFFERSEAPEVTVLEERPAEEEEDHRIVVFLEVAALRQDEA